MPAYTGTDASEEIEGTDLDDQIDGRGGDDLIAGYGGNDVIQGGAGNDGIHGGDGDDEISGGTGDDLLAGGAGRDIIRGGDGVDGILFDNGDTVYGDAGNDLFEIDVVPGGNDIRIDGGEGNDVLNLAPAGGAVIALNDSTFAGVAIRVTSVETILLGSGPSTIYGGSAGETLGGGPGIGPLKLFGGGGNDVLTSGAGANILYGEAGDDIIRVGAGADDADGGDGYDILDFSNSPLMANLDLGLTDFQPTPGGQQRYRNFEEVRGSSSNDRLIAGALGVTLNGMAGDDVIQGGAGNDILIGGAQGMQGDTLSYAHATEGVTVNLALGTATNAGQGTDTFSGFENITGSRFNDLLTGDAGDNVFRGGVGDDRIEGGAGYDTVIYDANQVEITYDGTTVVIRYTGPVQTEPPFGNPIPTQGTDTLTGVEAIQLSDNSIILVENLGVSRRGGDGDDVLTGTANYDYLYGGGGNDILYALGGGKNYLYGEAGNDHLYGGDGNDELFGDAGDDILEGAGGSNVLYGGDGDDRLIIQNPYDTYLGGEGIDTVVYGGSARITFQATDTERLELTGSADTAVEATFAMHGTFIQGNAGANHIRGSMRDDEIRGGAGDDLIEGGGGYDTIYGEGGADRIIGTNSALIADGGDGDDYILGNDAFDTMNGGAGNDILIGLGRDDVINGGDGYDIAVYEGVRGGYATATSSRVTGGVEGGTDTITGVETLAFVDGQLTFHRDGMAAQVMRLYDSAFNRIPDESGFEAQLDAMERGVSLNDLAQLFVDSPEFQNTYGALSDRAFAEQLYRNVLDREGDAGGIANALNSLSTQGGTLTRGQLLVAFSESTEHKDLTQGTLDQGLWIADEQTLIIARLYDAAWNRLPDEGGLITWRNALGGGLTLKEIADIFSQAPEFTNTYGTLTDRQFIEQLYRNVLDREGDEAGIQNALNAIAGGSSWGDIMLAFSESPEHVAVTRDLWIGGVSLYGSSSASIETKDAGEPQTLPGVDEFVPLDAGNDDGALVLPGVDDGLVRAKEADEALVLPGLDDGSVFVTPSSPAHVAFDHRLDLLDDAFIALRNEGWMH